MKTARMRMTAAVFVLAMAGISNGALIAYYDFGTTSPSPANQGTLGAVADGVLMNGATIVDIDTTARGVEWALQLNNTTGSSLADCQYMNITNGDDTWYDTAIPAGSGARTYAAWVRMDTSTTQTWSTILSKGFETAVNVAAGTPSGNGMDQVVFSHQTGFASWSPLKGTVSVMSDWAWSHVVATIDGEDFKTGCLYINGVLQDSRQTWGALYQNDLDLLIGAEPNRTAYQFGWNGMIDDVRIYDEYLDEYDVVNLFLDTSPSVNPWISIALDRVEITGPEVVAEGSQVQYTATAFICRMVPDWCFDIDVTNHATWWVEPDTFASIDDGLLTVGNIDTPEIISIYAECTLGGVTKVGELEVLCSNEYHVDGVGGDNGNDGLTRETAFATIQKGIDTAQDGQTVLVWPGVYNEAATNGINFKGKAITVKSAADAAVLEVPGFAAVTFALGEDENSVFSNFVVRGSNIGIFALFADPTINNVTVVDNNNGAVADNAGPVISNSIFWNNSNGDLFDCTAQYSCIEETGVGVGNISSEPLFADWLNRDYHLKSRNGRWDPVSETWVKDDNTSPCIDAGDPALDPMDEPDPCGGRINMGAYGGTAYASMTGIGEYYVIEDFESYSSTTELKAKWDSAGGTLGYFKLNLEYPHSDLKCLRLEYWTYDSPYYCGVSRTETPWIPADWTFAGTAETLSLWFSPGGSDPNLSINGVDELYVRLKDSSDREATVQYTDNWPVSNFDNGGHQEWNIGLQEFVDDNPAIDLTNVKMLEMGVLDGLGNPPAQTGDGYIYFDDIRLYPRRCILKYGQPEADLNDDCVVDGIDLSIMAGDWLDYDYNITAVSVDPCDANLVAHWKLDESDPCTVAVDSSGNGHHGTVHGDVIWDPNGKIDGAIKIFDQWGSGDYIDCGGGKNNGEPNTWADITGEITVTAWVKPDFQYCWSNYDPIVGKGSETSWDLKRGGSQNPEPTAVSFYVDVPEVPWYGVGGSTGLFDDKWHHVAGVYKIHQPGVSSEVQVYTDGAKEGSLACSGLPIGTCNWPVSIGNTLDRVMIMVSGWYGLIDDVRIYDRALDHSEIVGIVKEAPLGPLASYEFEVETGGVTPDSSGGHDGTLVNGATIVYDADRDSNVLELDGVDAYVELADSGHDLNEPNCTDEPANCTWADITGEFTFAAWVKPDISDSGNYRAVVFGKGDDGGYHRDYPSEPNRPREGWSMLRLNSDNVVTAAVTSTPRNLTPVSGIVPNLIDVNVWDGKWHHIAATYGPFYLDLYIDGIKATEYWGFWEPTYPSTTNYPIWIGANVGEVLGGGAYADGYHGWKGRIDDVRIYDRALTEFEIGNVMGGADVYVPLTSLANLYDEELVNNKIINFRDYQILADGWLEDETFPFGY